MKEKLEEIMENITELIPNFIYKGVNTKQALSYIRKSHEEYADWKIKECLLEEPEIETSPTCCKGAFSAGFVRCKNMMLIKAGIKKDLSNKDKK